MSLTVLAVPASVVVLVIVVHMPGHLVLVVPLVRVRELVVLLPDLEALVEGRRLVGLVRPQKMGPVLVDGLGVAPVVNW